MNIGDRIPQVACRDQHGKTVDLFEHFPGDHAMLIIFYAPGCNYSQKYIDRFEKLIRRYEQDKLRIMFISAAGHNGYRIDGHGFEALVKAAGRTSSFVRFAKDRGRAIASKFDVRVTPEAFLFNENGELVYQGAIDDSWRHPDIVTRVYLQDALESTLDHYAIDFPVVEAVGTPIRPS